MTDKEMTKHMVHLTQSVKFLLEEAKKSYESFPFKTKSDCKKIDGIRRLVNKAEDFLDAEAAERANAGVSLWEEYQQWLQKFNEKKYANYYKQMGEISGMVKDSACSKEKQEEMLVRTFHHREGYYHKWSFAIYEKDRYIPEGDYMMMGNQIVHSRETFNSQVEAEKAGEEVIRKIRATKSP